MKKDLVKIILIVLFGSIFLSELRANSCTDEAYIECFNNTTGDEETIVYQRCWKPKSWRYITLKNRIVDPEFAATPGSSVAVMCWFEWSREMREGER